MFLQLFIINKSGSLIFHQDLSPAAPRLSSNDSLRLGSTFHSLHAIAAQVAPIASSGIEKLETATYRLRCLQTLTGAKFVITAQPNTPELEVVLQGIYELYTDYVLKNPFYELEMPIRCELFTQHLEKLVERYNAASR
ncbi:Sybindin-like protein [Tribonema minus]|uniref:Trafficking protein particle complex subunit n=1 Tax=Tribonema minus TaxID=303371 RepID=A0A835ZDL6_9STRA|nr:Sybindin-like protein [Tribonema minus]